MPLYPRRPSFDGTTPHHPSVPSTPPKNGYWTPASPPSSRNMPFAQAPNTPPPRKQWEFHYRTFLNRQSSQQQHQRQSPPSTPRIVCEVSYKRASCPQLVRVDDDDNNNVRSDSKTTKASLATSTDTSVRGGSFFKGVFKKKNKKSALTAALTGSSGGSSGSSDDEELDQCLRRGRSTSRSSPNSIWAEQCTSSGGGNGDNGGFVSPLHHLRAQMSHMGMNNGSTAPSSSDELDEVMGRHRPPPTRLGSSCPILAGRSPSPSYSHHYATQQQQPAMNGSGGGTPHVVKKKTFTKFHNSGEYGHDTGSAYLGDETSYHSKTNFVGLYGRNSSNSLEPQGYDDPANIVLPRLDENLTYTTTPLSILPPPSPVDTWQSNKKYCMAPAIIAMCPASVISLLTLKDPSQSSPQELHFGKHHLGRAAAWFISPKSTGWREAVFVLRQNYLLEYGLDEDGAGRGRPRGMAHLENATVRPHESHEDMFYLTLAEGGASDYGRKIVIRIPPESKRSDWIAFLLRASQLQISDLYQYDPSAPPLGNGRYGTVHRARRRSCSQCDSCALKIIQKGPFWDRVKRGKERLDAIVREVAVQATLSLHQLKTRSHQNSFVSIKSFFETRENVVLELELMSGNDLFSHVSSRGTLKECDAARIIHDLLQSLLTMSSLGIAHRDVKLANILMCPGTSSLPRIKLGDYGMAAFVGEDGLLRGRCGTPGYVAPEILSAGVNDGYRNNCDIFSAGVTLYILLCGYEPFYGETDAELVAANREAIVEFPEEDWNGVSEEAKDLVRKMLERDGERRIGVREALRHSWILEKGEGIINGFSNGMSSVQHATMPEVACSVS